MRVALVLLLLTVHPAHAAPPLRETVDDFPQLVATTAGQLAQEPENRSLRRLWKDIQAEVDTSSVPPECRMPIFSSFDLLPIWFRFLLPLAFGIAVFGIVARFGHLRALAALGGLTFVTYFAWAGARETGSFEYFQSQLVVLKDPINPRRGNSPLYPESLHAPLPSGFILKVLHENSGWLQVELSPARRGWVPKSTVIEVVRSARE